MKHISRNVTHTNSRITSRINSHSIKKLSSVALALVSQCMCMQVPN
ncbi:hypothetical protein [Psychrosphaera haliotis]|uniref:Uncharacterized protein n=1 Tax=Psychrosphaera haliotis TaxID=555083 RepID=A0A6N8F582_9GAMM|nr:hypothetical protein [Psychrosphaera haliotis]MUH71806.1 hypothetical protein [Psychrosphaera haliotis]